MGASVGRARQPSSPPGLALRVPTDAEWQDFCASMGETFIERFPAEDVAEFRKLADIDRAVAGFDADGRVRATGGSYALRMSVPGGAEVPTCGVSWITVSTPYRRRGVLTAMSRQIFELAKERGEPVAALYAAEGGIYRRFGFGVAAQMWDLRVPARALESVPASAGRVEEVDREAAAARFPRVFKAAYAGRPGVNARDRRRWAAELHEWAEDKKDWQARRFLVYVGAGGQDLGCAVLRLKGTWKGHRADGRAQLSEMHLARADAVAAIWRYAGSVDLVTRVTAPHRPADDPLPLLLADPRDAGWRQGEELWIRLLDPGVALERRAYRCDGRLRLAVADDFWPEAAGTYELEVTGGVASCRRTRRKPDLEMRVPELGAAYLGSGSFNRMAAAGLVREVRRGAVQQADAMFAWTPAAFCPEVF